uniref:Uncharacterized protein n=1 Tax=Rhizophora mucronata TaxID=61149 RepID=A0A2P2JHN2_RHIMU
MIRNDLLSTTTPFLRCRYKTKAHVPQHPLHLEVEAKTIAPEAQMEKPKQYLQNLPERGKNWKLENIMQLICNEDEVQMFQKLKGEL